MKKILFIILFIGISLLIIACNKNDTRVDIRMKFDVSNLTNDEFSYVGTSELENAQKEDFKKINFTLKVTNPDDITKRNIVFPELVEIKERAKDRFWYSSGYNDDSKLKSAEHGYEFILYAKGLDNHDINEMFGSLKAKVTWYSADGVYIEKIVPVSDVIQFN